MNSAVILIIYAVKLLVNKEVDGLYFYLTTLLLSVSSNFSASGPFKIRKTFRSTDGMEVA